MRPPSATIATMKRWSLFGILVAVALTAGCGSGQKAEAVSATPKTESRAKVEGGWKQVASPDGRIQFLAPSSWVVASKDGADFKALRDKMDKRNPGSSKTFDMFIDNKTFPLFAVESDESKYVDGFAQNLNVVVMPGQLDTSDKGLAAAIPEIKKALHAEKPSEAKIIELPAGKGIAYSGELANGQGVHVTGFIIGRGDENLTFTFSCKVGSQDQMKPIFTKMMESVQLK